jgi:hypothetical protein
MTDKFYGKGMKDLMDRATSQNKTYDPLYGQAITEVLEDIVPLGETQALKPLYIAGPMSGIPGFNFPLFNMVTAVARKEGFTVISPAELDAEGYSYDLSINSPDGKFTPELPTWGDFLGRDVRIVADECSGIIFLPGWNNSKGARLEAYVALACGYTDFFIYAGQGLIMEYPRDNVVRGVRSDIR